MAISECCVRGFEWDGTPTGRIDNVSNNDVYIAGTNKDRAVILIHDLFGWTFANNRLLADRYAAEIDATVYLPDFFGGEVISSDLIRQEKWAEIDVGSFIKRQSRETREPEIFAFARELRNRHKKVGAIGFCYGGWAVFRLGAKEHDTPLVDCISAAHPSLLTKQDMDEAAVPVQLLAPEIDLSFTAEFKTHSFEVLQKTGHPFAYEHFPGVVHGGLVRGDETKPGERDAMVQAKDAAVGWFKRFL